MTPEFFTADNIALLNRWGSVIYNKKNALQKQAVKSIMDEVWEPSYYWARQICENNSGYSFKGRANWKEGAGPGKFKFKHYTWYKIFPTGSFHPELYFTVGVDGKHDALIIKIDFQRESSEFLNSAQKKYLNSKVDRNLGGPYWTKIPATDLSNYNWESLIDFSNNFIRKHIPLFNEISVILQNLSLEHRIARLAWNSNGWLFPSGQDGKSTDKKSHEFKYGYGHEEWLFDLNKKYKGYHYGFLEPIRKQQNAFIGNQYKVWLYTIDGVTKKRYFVGNIERIEVLTKEQAEEVKLEYKKRGWLKEMEDQIPRVNKNHKGFSGYKGLDIFNIRFKSQDLKDYEPYLELPGSHPIYKQSRYVFGRYDESFDIENYEVDDFSLEDSNVDDDSEDYKKVKKKTYKREPKAIQITYLHEAISKQLTKHLKSIYGKNKVWREKNAGYGSNRIDIVVETQNRVIFYEIKTYNNVRTSIREAIGQLLEYSCWPNKRKAQEFVIITQPVSNTKKAIEYLKHLNSIMSIPVFYQNFDVETNLLSERNLINVE
ncbi:MAG: hypothetical protein J0L69_01200 [Bacteroidetes bacterium]|nr:hypothetical protein [Bacteroidota bacterium]